jgi:uncharacterized membrane protein YoaK (UPF0700 family)
VVLVGVAVAGARGLFEPFDSAVETTSDFVLLSLLSLSMGLQNASVSSATGMVVRTTHLTGAATDLGIHLASACFAEGERRRTSARHAALRAGKITAFAAGGALALPLGGRLAYGAFFVAAAMVLIATAVTFRLGADVAPPSRDAAPL